MAFSPSWRVAPFSFFQAFCTHTLEPVIWLGGSGKLVPVAGACMKFLHFLYSEGGFCFSGLLKNFVNFFRIFRRIQVLNSGKTLFGTLPLKQRGLSWFTFLEALSSVSPDKPVCPLTLTHTCPKSPHWLISLTFLLRF